MQDNLIKEYQMEQIFFFVKSYSEKNSKFPSWRKVGRIFSLDNKTARKYYEEYLKEKDIILKKQEEVKEDFDQNVNKKECELISWIDDLSKLGKFTSMDKLFLTNYFAMFFYIIRDIGKRSKK